jgi:translocator protein
MSPTKNLEVLKSIDDGPAANSSGTRQFLVLIGLIAVCFAAAGIGATATSSSVGTWYQTLAKPSWNPPSWIFGPVWTVLYLLMAIAAWLVWLKAGWDNARAAITWFALQLVLNVLWSFLFFGLHLPGWAFVEIIFLWAAILITTVLFCRQSVTAAALLIPYLAWTAFAAVLNFTLWKLNA